MPEGNSPLRNIPNLDLDGSDETLLTPSPVAPTDGEASYETPTSQMVGVAPELDNDAQAPDDVPTEAGPVKRGVSEGFSAMSEVRRAKREHADARDKLAKLQAEIESDNHTLEHRIQVERDFEQIVADQTAAIDAATKHIEELQGTLDEADSQREALEGQLADMKAAHAKDLEPYQQLAEAAKKRADSDQSAFNSARKAARAAEKHLKDLTKRRDGELDRAKRTINAAADQITSLNARLAELSSDPAENAGKISELNAEIAAQTAQREQATARLKTIPDEAAGAIKAAQATLASAKKQLEGAKSAADASKRDADGKNGDYKNLRSKYRGEEDALNDQIVEVQKRIRGINSQMADTRANLEAAQSILKEAEDIHATPEATKALEEKVRDNSAAATVQQQQVQALAEAEQEVRARTRQSRVRLIIMLILIAVVVCLIIWLIIAYAG